MEELESWIGDEGCSRVTAEERAATTGTRAIDIWAAGDGGAESFESRESQPNIRTLGVVETAYHVVLHCEIDGFRTLFLVPFQDVTKRKEDDRHQSNCRRHCDSD